MVGKEIPVNHVVSVLKPCPTIPNSSSTTTVSHQHQHPLRRWRGEKVLTKPTRIKPYNAILGKLSKYRVSQKSGHF